MPSDQPRGKYDSSRQPDRGQNLKQQWEPVPEIVGSVHEGPQSLSAQRYSVDAYSSTLRFNCRPVKRRPVGRTEQVARNEECSRAVGCNAWRERAEPEERRGSEKDLEKDSEKERRGSKFDQKHSFEIAASPTFRAIFFALS